MSDRPLDVYLNDHLAGSTFGRDLARRIASETPDPDVRSSIDGLADEIDQDRARLEYVMERVGAKQNTLMVAGGALAERLSHIFTGMGSVKDELGMFEALEALSLGVEGKRCMWEALTEVREQYPGLSEVDLDELLARASRQRKVLEDLRISAAGRALAASVGTASR